MSCQDTQTSTSKKQKTNTDSITKALTKPKKKITLTKKIPLVNPDSVVQFFTAYGNNHHETKVLLETRLGDIQIKLYKETPLHRANFLFLINEGYFDTTCFHRVVKNFIIQAGQSDNPKTADIRKKTGIYRLPPEFVTKHKHHKGAISAARRWNKNPKKLSDAFEFFIVHDNRGLHHLDQEHTTFGSVIRGMEVIDKIADESIDKGEWPIKDVFLKVSIK